MCVASLVVADLGVVHAREGGLVREREGGVGSGLGLPLLHLSQEK